MVRDKVFIIAERIFFGDLLHNSILWDVTATWCNETEIPSRTKYFDNCVLPLAAVVIAVE